MAELKQIPQGYKQTEVGVIPEDWNSPDLIEYIILENGYSFKSEFFSKSGPIVLTPGNFNLKGGLYFQNRNTIYYSGIYLKKFELLYGDMVVVMTDLTPTCNLLGKPAFIDRPEILHNQRIGKIRIVNPILYEKFLYFFFTSDIFSKRMKSTATGSTVRHTSKKIILQTQIPLPPTKAEQEAIAGVLSDTDELIRSLERLVDKKRNVKQGAMQALLTGKKRLPGFGEGKGTKQTEVGVIPEDWEVFQISDLTPPNKKYSIVDGPFGSNLKTIHYRKSGIPIITSGYVTDGKFYAKNYLYIDQQKFKEERRSAVEAGDIVMAKIGERCGASAILPKDHEISILSGNALKISIDKDNFNNDLISQILWSHHKSGLLDNIRSTGAQPAISMSSLKKYRIPLPPAKAEQEAIAGLLSDMDAEIEGLEQRLVKYRELKQGLMQVLLTGKVRLV